MVVRAGQESDAVAVNPSDACLTISLAEGGAGLGAVWREEAARRMLTAAGFTAVEVVASPRPQNAISICRKEEA